MTELQEFFEKHINIIKDEKCKCEECGVILKGRHGEVAHVLNKSYFKSVATDDDNVIYLCDQFSENNCHGKLDNSSLSIVKEMRIYKKLQETFEKIRVRVKESINYKIEDRFGS